MKISDWMKSVVVVLGVALASSAPAAEVSAETAAKAVGNWRVRKGQLGTAMGRRVAESRRVEHGGARFNVVRMEGGGYVVTPADTAVRPVIMFSDDDDFVVSDENPGLSLLVSELSKLPAPAPKLRMASAAPSDAEAEWAELLADRPALSTARVASLDDVRVEPLVKAKWNQGGVTVDGVGMNCFNYYTPYHRVCGCVATAAAQIMRYLEYPNAPIPSFVGKYCQVSGVTKPMTAQGGTYEWAKMPYDPRVSGTTEENCKAIGKLTSDIGIGVAMNYTSTGGSANTYTVRYALMTFFGYSNAIACYAPIGTSTTRLADYKRVMCANFDAKIPVQIALQGHSIVGDGYGYIGSTIYYHLNYGWSGTSNAWYAPPDDVDIRGMVHNIYTNQNKNLVIASGRVTGSDGLPAKGVTVRAEDANGDPVGDAATTDKHGIYALYVSPGTYTVRARGDIVNARGEVVGEACGTTTASPTKCVSIGTAAGGGVTLNVKQATGNDSGRDIELEDSYYELAGTADFVGAVTLGTNFATAAASVAAQVTQFGTDCDSATLTVALYRGEVSLGERTFTLTDRKPHTETASFDGLAAGDACRLVATLTIGGNTVAETEYPFEAAREYLAISELADEPRWTERDASALRTFAPTSAVMSAREVVVDAKMDGFHDMAALSAPADVRAGVAAVWAEKEFAGEFAIWDGAQWRRTGVAVEEGAVNRISMLFEGGKVSYGVRRNGARIALGEGTLPAETGDGAVQYRGATDLLAVSGYGVNANLIARADGTAEYANLDAVLAAEETGTIKPLWATSGAIAGDVPLLVLAVLDPKNLLNLTGGNLLRKKTGSDGATIYCYGTADKAEAAANSDYLRATSALGLSDPIQKDSEIALGELEAADGAMSFKVAVDGAAVTRGRVADFVQIAEDPAKQDWRTPNEGEIAVAEGVVTVRPKTDKGRAFTKVVIPKD